MKKKWAKKASMNRNTLIMNIKLCSSLLVVSDLSV